jgi:hypothetical protein
MSLSVSGQSRDVEGRLPAHHPVLAPGPALGSRPRVARLRPGPLSLPRVRGAGQIRTRPTEDCCPMSGSRRAPQHDAIHLPSSEVPTASPRSILGAWTTRLPPCCQGGVPGNGVASQTRAVQSMLPETSRWPSGLKTRYAVTASRFRTRRRSGQRSTWPGRWPNPGEAVMSRHLVTFPKTVLRGREWTSRNPAFPNDRHQGFSRTWPKSGKSGTAVSGLASSS